MAFLVNTASQLSQAEGGGLLQMDLTNEMGDSVRTVLQNNQLSAVVLKQWKEEIATEQQEEKEMQAIQSPGPEEDLDPSYFPSSAGCSQNSQTNTATNRPGASSGQTTTYDDAHRRRTNSPVDVSQDGTSCCAGGQCRDGGSHHRDSRC